MNPIDHEILSFLFKGALFSAGAVAAGWLLAKRCSAQTMSLYWRGAALGLIALPLVAIYLPLLPLLDPSSSTAPTPELAPAAAISELRASYPSSADAGTAIAPTASEGAFTQDPKSGSSPWMFIVWLTGSALVVSRWGFARLAASRLCRGATAIADADWNDALRSLGVSPRRVRMLISPNATLPMVWGSFRSVLLLPPEAAE